MRLDVGSEDVQEEPESERVREGDNDTEGDDVGLWRLGHRELLDIYGDLSQSIPNDAMRQERRRRWEDDVFPPQLLTSDSSRPCSVTGCV